LTRYGDRLVCVRYRYDAGAGMRYKTVELIIEQARWTPPPPHPHAQEPKLRVDDFEEAEPPLPPKPAEVGVKVFFRENDLRNRVKAAGGRWSKAEKLDDALRNRGGTRTRTPHRQALMFLDMETCCQMWKHGSTYGNGF
jgi:hypothetical protein